jgi:hypothetical protein
MNYVYVPFRTFVHMVLLQQKRMVPSEPHHAYLGTLDLA